MDRLVETVARPAVSAPVTVTSERGTLTIPPAAIAKSLTEGLGRMVEGMTGSMSDTVCTTVRDACREDFDGRICTAARERYQ